MTAHAEAARSSRRSRVPVLVVAAQRRSSPGAAHGAGGGARGHRTDPPGWWGERPLPGRGCAAAGCQRTTAGTGLGLVGPAARPGPCAARRDAVSGVAAGARPTRADRRRVTHRGHGRRGRPRGRGVAGRAHRDRRNRRAVPLAVATLLPHPHRPSSTCCAAGTAGDAQGRPGHPGPRRLAVTGGAVPPVAAAPGPGAPAPGRRRAPGDRRPPAAARLRHAARRRSHPQLVPALDRPCRQPARRAGGASLTSAPVHRPGAQPSAGHEPRRDRSCARAARHRGGRAVRAVTRGRDRHVPRRRARRRRHGQRPHQHDLQPGRPRRRAPARPGDAAALLLPDRGQGTALQLSGVPAGPPAAERAGTTPRDVVVDAAGLDRLLGELLGAA